MKDKKQIILEIISAQCGIDWLELKEEMLMGDNLGLDSLGLDDIVVELEREFDIVIPDREADEAINTESTVLNIVEYIISKHDK